MATYTLTINYGASGATINTNCGTAGVYHNGNYWYKITSSKVYRSSTSATSGFSLFAPSKSATNGSSGTSKKVYFDLLNIATPGFIRPGYHTVSASAWKTPGGLALNQDTSATSDTNAATVYRILDNKYISANKTVTIQPNWVGNSYTINYDGNGATSGSTASSSHVYGTAKDLTVNGFSKTGYIFEGWSKKQVGNGTTVFQNSQMGTISYLGTDGKELYLFSSLGTSVDATQITIDGSNTYIDKTNVNTSAMTYIERDSTTSFLTYQNKFYKFIRPTQEILGVVIQYDSASVDFINSESITTITDASGEAPSNGDTITLYAVWSPVHYTISYNASGGSGTTSASSHTYGISQALTANGFSKTGYTFQGWSKISSTPTRVFYIRDNGPCYPDAIGTNGNDMYLKYNSRYYSVALDGTNDYIDLGTTEPSGVTWVTETGAENTIAYENQLYYYTKFSNHDHDWCYIYRIHTGSVDFTDEELITTITDTSGNAPSDGDTITLYAVWQSVPIYVKDSGAWTTAVPYVKVNSTWKTVDEIHVKINGSWQQIT